MTSEFYENEAITSAEEKLSSRQAFARLVPYLLIHKFALIICLVLLAGATVLSLSWPVLLKRAIDVNISSGDYRGLIITVTAIGLIQALTLILQYIQTVKLETIGQDIMVELKRRLFDHIISLDVAFFDNNPVGRLMARIESDTESLRLLFTRTVVMVVGDLILIVGIFGVMLYYSWRLTLILSLTIPFIVSLIYLFQRLTTERFFSVRKKMAIITASLTEFFHGMNIIQAFDRGDYVRDRLNRENKSKFKDDTYIHFAVVWFFNSVYFFEKVMIALVLLFGMIWLNSGILTVGTISMFIVLIWRSFEPIHRASEQLANIQKAIAGAKRIFALLANNQKLPETTKPVTWRKLEDAIRFENVWFSYGNDGHYVLKDVSFEVPVGQQIALAGVTGGGKSTIISLLLRLYDPQKGRITVDGTDIRELSFADLRRRFALVLQDIHLFPGDIKSNIALDTDGISDDMIAEAARVVEADTFIQRLPDKYTTTVSEKGSNFSRGERQLLSFARALAVNPDVLILDEATSSVDPHTERTVQRSLKKLMTGRTSLVIAHRLTTILEADQILVLKDGELIERGSHTELILQNGYYSKLFHLQFKNGVLENVAQN